MKDIKKDKPGTGLIPGIYEFCDRWCERCAFTTQCLSYMMGEKFKARTTEDDESEDDEEYWMLSEETFDSAEEVIKEIADERGVAVEDIYKSERIYRKYWGEDYEDVDNEDEKISSLIDSEDIILSFHIYEQLADRLQLILSERMEEVGESDAELKQTDLVERLLIEIGWYLDVFYLKIRRAFYGYFLSVSGDKEKSYDSDGSAKMALISLNISKKSWREIGGEYPEFESDIDHIFVVLDQISRDMREKFPNAEKFKRPGFDK